MIWRLATIKPSTGIRAVRTFGSGDVAKGSTGFSKKEHAQEEQFFRQREREELEKYREELRKSGDAKGGPTGKKDSPKRK